MKYSVDEINEAMRKWSSTENTMERLRNWFEYVDKRDGNPIGHSEKIYLANRNVNIIKRTFINYAS